MKRLVVTLALASLSLGACTSTNLRSALGTPKNPTPILSDPRPEPADKADPRLTGDTAFVIADYNVLRDAVTGEGVDAKTVTDAIKPEVMRPYILAGFHLSDTYCDTYLRRTDEAYRRRKFGRSVTNDAGTAITSILGLANAGKDVITGSAALFGFGDSIWRNYDDSFLVTTDLSNVRALVFAAQENYRQQVFGPGTTLPVYYSDAQSIIKKYAGFCSYLGMTALLDKSAAEKAEQIENDTQARKNAPAAVPSPIPAAPAAAPAPTSPHPTQLTPPV